jgi:predicted short-subunit dehydrogenase-like oxidoreductase (DUF2520 family)
MNEIKRRFAIFGAGRVGRSMAAYWRSLGHEVRLVERAQTADAAAAARIIAAADAVAVALPDSAIAEFAHNHRNVLQHIDAIHFSGASSFDGLTAYHPLYSFPQTEIPAQQSAAILIARDAGTRPYSAIVPGACNPEIALPPGARPLYHALAVVSGNFAAHLMNEAAAAFARRFGADPALLAPYFGSVAARFAESPLSSMTGPVARGDAGAVATNLEALAGEPQLEALYRAFLKSAWPEYPQERAKGGPE